MKKSLFVIIVALAAGALHAKTQSGGTPRAPKRTPPPEDTTAVLAPVPEDLKGRGKIFVAGEKGSNQSDKFTYRRCEVIPDETEAPQFKKSGCGAEKSASIAQEISVRPGFYLLVYSDTIFPMPVEVKIGHTSTVRLRKLKVPHENSKFTFQVFRDLSSPEEQEKISRYVWAISNFARSQSICSGLPEWNQSGTLFAKYCASATTEDFGVFKKNYYLFDEHSNQWSVNFEYNTRDSGRLYMVRVPYWDFQKRQYVTDPRDGEFVSVFPGVYGITYTDTRNQETSEKLGKVVSDQGSSAVP